MLHSLDVMCISQNSLLLILTHWGRVTHICVGEQTIIGSDNGFNWQVPSHYLNQCWNIVIWILGNKLQSNLNRNLYIFIQENAFENAVWKMVATLSRPQCVNSLWSNTITAPVQRPWKIWLKSNFMVCNVPTWLVVSPSICHQFTTAVLLGDNNKIGMLF